MKYESMSHNEREQKFEIRNININAKMLLRKFIVVAY